ncbi:hypothetical protein [Cytophaga sp. FL35]|uniref:hypothetical protein n=1 Tax=Cytophaga sp. FL35 TaxID=1904456 RepID=UPI001653D330|nr:hypothetical protein [Cytophaga sp. FL35]MBC7000846.1 hypothetical protein [Cytophaga sp. FL35]
MTITNLREEQEGSTLARATDKPSNGKPPATRGFRVVQNRGTKVFLMEKCFGAWFTGEILMEKWSFKVLDSRVVHF